MDALRWRQFSLAHDPRITRDRDSEGKPAMPAMTAMTRPTLQQLNKEKCYWTMTKLLGSNMDGLESKCIAFGLLGPTFFFVFSVSLLVLHKIQ